MNPVIYSVLDVNKYIKATLTNDDNLRYILVKGEISNFKISGPGHIYFSLKDDESVINAVMFANMANKLIFTPKNGDEVIVLASVDVYAPRGSYQLFVYEMNLEGQGNILVNLEKLKKQLASEGLFDESRKRKINLFPKNIGLITAANSAAEKDLIFNIQRRYPIATIYLFHSSVQGEKAPKELLDAFLLSQNYPLDTLIIGRGGGANEDLNAFNDEKLVRAVAGSKMPVIAAVGHEIDSTLIDFVADKRASTPTGAAELATIDQREVIQKISYLYESMSTALKEKVEDLKEEISDYKENIKNSLLSMLDNQKTILMLQTKRLSALNPSSILERGYSITYDSNGNVVTDINKLNRNEKITTKLRNGEVISEVEEIIHG